MISNNSVQSDRLLFRQELDQRTSEQQSQWWTRTNTMADAIQHVTPWIMNPTEISEADMLQARLPHRAVFRYSTNSDRPDLVFKVIYLSRFRNRLRYRRFAFHEAVNTMRAHERGLRVPQTLAYGHFRHWGQVWCTVCCTGYVSLPLMVNRFYDHQPKDDEIQELLARAGTMLRRIHDAGCIHIDFGPHAIMMSPQGTQDDYLIDFELAKFLPRTSRRATAAQAGYFSWAVATNRNWITSKRIRSWFEELLDDWGWNDSADELLPIWQRCFSRREPMKQRLRWAM